jgi:hypothetical protein
MSVSKFVTLKSMSMSKCQKFNPVSECQNFKMPVSQCQNLVLGTPVNHTPKCITKWSTIYTSLSNTHNTTWKNIFKQAFITCRETKLQSFQFKLIHITIACNHWLYNIKITDSDKCLFCNTQSDTIQLYFLLCHNVNNFWVTFNNWWKSVTNKDLIEIATTNSLQTNILFGFQDHNGTTEVLNYFALQAKYYIYNKKINKINDLFILDFLIILKRKLIQER